MPLRPVSGTVLRMADAFDRSLQRLVEGLRATLAEDLVSVVLFGSGAEGRRRVVSDTNLAIVLRRLDPARASAARDLVALAGVALRLRLLVLREDEIADAARAFAVKFADIQRRRRVLHGSDPFAAMEVPRPAAIAQLRQAALNLVLRLRQLWLGTTDARQLTRSAAHLAGGLRVCAAELLVLEGAQQATPRAALEVVAGDPMRALSDAREGRLPPADAEPLVLRMLEVAEAIRGRAERLA